MNLITFLIVIVVLLGFARGYIAGFGRTVLPAAGFVIGLLCGAWLAGFLAKHVGQEANKLLVAVATELLLAVLGATIGELASIRTDYLTQRLHLGPLNSLLGGVFGAVFVLLLSWFMASGVSNVQAYGIGREAQNSAIIRTMNRLLPAPPDLLSRLAKIIKPNDFPNVFLLGEPKHAVINPGQEVDATVVAAAEQSVVKIEGSGCGGEVEGSGFVVAPGVVVTNAHVIAGVAHPRVLDSRGTYRTTTWWFDSNEDIAVLYVAGLRDPVLSVSTPVAADGSAAAILGYPGGGPLSVGDAVVIDNTEALGQDIYNRGRIVRDIYEVAANVEPGNSGGPLINDSGQVIGVVFTKSVSQDDVGYALLGQDVQTAVQKAEAARTPVSTGECAAD